MAGYGRMARQAARQGLGWLAYLFAALAVVSLAFRVLVHFGVI